MSENYKFVQNKECEYFPCHKVEEDKFNCLFCYCPLYMLGDDCGGNVKYTDTGIKNCSDCTLPHIKDIGFDHVSKKMLTVINKVKKR